MSRSRNWVFTLNNYTQDEEKHIQEELQCRYVVYGREVGEQQTPHLQGFVAYQHPQRLASVKQSISSRAHVEPAKTLEEAIAYCKKDGDFYERGDPPMSQKRKGEAGKEVYEEAFQLAKQGRFEEIQEPLRTRFWGTYLRVAARYQQSPESQAELDFHWFYGPSGTGKSRSAREENPGAFLKLPNKWWDGYVDQECVIIDEWAPSHHVLADHLKRWADHHAFAAEVKGGTITIRPKKIIITSNYTMEECFQDPGALEPLLRRFNKREFS